MKTYTVDSDSRAGVVYSITVTDAGVVLCSCPGFRNRGKCKHAGKEQRKVEQPALLDTAWPVRYTEEEEAAMGFIEPMLAEALDDDKSIEDYTGEQFWLEEKYDGHRLILRIINRKIRAYSRAGNVRILPEHLTAQVKFLPDGTYDGELYIPGTDHSQVKKLDRQHELKLALFDILAVGDDSAMDRDNLYRRSLLKLAVREVEDASMLFVAPAFPVTNAGLLAIWCRGGEGAIVKDGTQKYLPGKRVKGWVKFKRFVPGRATITGFEAGLLGPHSRICGVDKNGISVKTKALNDKWRAFFLTRSGEVIGKTLVFEHQGMATKGKYKSPMAQYIEGVDL